MILNRAYKGCPHTLEFYIKILEREQLRVISAEGEPLVHVACGEGSYFCNLFDLPTEKKGIVSRKPFGRDTIYTLDADPEGEAQNTKENDTGRDVLEKWVSAGDFPVT